MLDLLAESGFKMAQWPASSQRFVFYGYAATFAIAAITCHWASRQAEARRPMAPAVTGLWIPACILMLLMSTAGLLALALATKTVQPFATQLQSLPGANQQFIARVQQVALFGLGFIVLICYGFWYWVRKARSEAPE